MNSTRKSALFSLGFTLILGVFVMYIRMMEVENIEFCGQVNASAKLTRKALSVATNQMGDLTYDKHGKILVEEKGTKLIFTFPALPPPEPEGNYLSLDFAAKITVDTQTLSIVEYEVGID